MTILDLGVKVTGKFRLRNMHLTGRFPLSTYYIGDTVVTQELWTSVMDGNNPSFFRGDKKPVDGICWDDCMQFIKKLNYITGKHFRLPTEAEWEYAARGGKKSKNCMFSGSNSIGEVAWYDETLLNSRPVKKKKSNELGIFDMSGNVWEWCEDWYGEYIETSQTNPSGPAEGIERVGRGGSWSAQARMCRVSARGKATPTTKINNLGFRLALSE